LGTEFEAKFIQELEFSRHRIEPAGPAGDGSAGSQRVLGEGVFARLFESLAFRPEGVADSTEHPVQISQLTKFFAILFKVNWASQRDTW